MFSALQVVQGPACEPISLDQARMHARIDQTAEDELLEGYITAAREWTELYLGRALVTQQLRWLLAHEQPQNGYPFLSMPLSLLILPMWFQWPLAHRGAIELPRLPVVSVDEISYGQWGQADTTLTAGTDYDVDTASGRLLVHPGSQVIPNDHMAITFTAGYGEDYEQVPRTIRTAIAMLTTFLYEHRGDAGGDMPVAVQMLLAPHKLFHFG